MPEFPLTDRVAPIIWRAGRIKVLDQRLLPRRIVYIECRSAEDIACATRNMALRGAPLIGCAAAYGMALASRGNSIAEIKRAAVLLCASRPTAINLQHAVDHMLNIAANTPKTNLSSTMNQAAHRYWQNDLEFNRTMAKLGAGLLKKNSKIITYCNAGALATSGLGTAIGVIRYAHHIGKVTHVYACETRPYLQGSRLTLWELMQANIPATLITDNMAAHIMKTKAVDAIIVGSDRIAANADVCNKIGTYNLAILAKHHKIPFYVVAPSTTVDFATPSGSHIPIEERSEHEVLHIFGKPIAPSGAHAHHFAFDVTPHELVTAIVTEKGIVSPANSQTLKKILP